MSKTKQRLWLLKIITIYILIAAVGFGIAYFVKTAFFPPQKASAPQIATRVTAAPTPAGWKTYTNKDYSLQFSYPPTDTIQNSSYGFGVSSISMKNANGNLDFQILFLPKQLGQAVGQDFDSYYAMPDNTSKVIKNPLAKDSTTDNFTKVRNRTINGFAALDYHSIPSNAPAGSAPEIGTFIEDGNNLVLISTGENNRQNLEKMLSTFSSF